MTIFDKVTHVPWIGDINGWVCLAFTFFFGFALAMNHLSDQMTAITNFEPERGGPG